MSGYVGLSKADSSNQGKSFGNFNQRVWGGQKDALSNLYSQLSGLFNQGTQGMQGQMGSAIGNANSVMGQANQGLANQIGGGAYANIDASKLQDQIYNSMQSPTNSQQINNMIMGGAGNNYADAMKGQYVQDANIATKNMLNNLDARASVAGMPGSSRQGIAQGVGIQGINQNLQRNLAETGYNTFDKDLDRKLAIAGQADQANLARQGMLSQMLAGKQGAMQGGLGMSGDIANLGQVGLGMFGAPWNIAGQYANAIGRPTILGSGSTNAVSQGSSNSFGMEGGGSASVICSELHRQGYLDGRTYTADELYGFHIRNNRPEIYSGYLTWAPSVVKVMRKSPIFTDFIWLIAKPWTVEMKYKMGYGAERSLVGKLIMAIGESICSYIGNSKETRNVPA